MVYRRRGRAAWFVEVPTRHGRVKRSTGTTDKPTALAMARMLAALGPRGRRDWELLDRLVEPDKTHRLTVAALYDAYAANDLDGLRARLQDADLAPHLAQWQRWLRDRVKPATAEYYLADLRTLIPEGAPFPRSRLTAPAISRWLAQDRAGRTISSGTRRKYLAVVQSFARYLVDVGVLATNPTRDVRAPKANRPRVVEIPAPDVLRIVEGAPAPYPALFALLYGAGVELSAALRCTESDVDEARREVRARGTKSYTRDRVVRVAEWAWPVLAKHLETLTPGERLFRGLAARHVRQVHAARLTALALPTHRVHDARRFYAIRAIKAGTPYELVARQLGHADIAMVARVYGRYAPRSEERDRWEQLAAKTDAMGTSVGTALDGRATQPSIPQQLTDFAADNESTGHRGRPHRR